MKDINVCQQAEKTYEFCIQYVLMTKTFNKLDIEETYHKAYVTLR